MILFQVKNSFSLRGLCSQHIKLNLTELLFQKYPNKRVISLIQLTNQLLDVLTPDCNLPSDWLCVFIFILFKTFPFFLCQNFQQKQPIKELLKPSRVDMTTKIRSCLRGNF